MLNHAQSAAMSPEIDSIELIGYKGSSLPEWIGETNGKVKVKYVSTKIIDKLKKLPKIFYFFYLILRILIQML
jgi:hypothetical protein